MPDSSKRAPFPLPLLLSSSSLLLSLRGEPAFKDVLSTRRKIRRLPVSLPYARH
jgi:hypothetical protein